MRRLIPILLILVPLLVFVPSTASPHAPGPGVLQTAGGGSPAGFWHSLQLGITAARDVLYLLAELTLNLLTGAWLAAPERWRVLFGVLIAVTGCLAVLGLASLAAAGRMSRRFLGEGGE